MRLGSLELLQQIRLLGQEIEQQRFDAVFATSLLNLGDLRAGLPSPMRMIPVAFYLHENQAAYPSRRIEGVEKEAQKTWDAQFALTNLTSCAAADMVLFNSRFNRHSFIEGIRALVAHSPDAELGSLIDRIESNAQVAWPPVEVPEDLEPDRLERGINKPTLVVWPHRWEHDKGPDELLEIAMRLSEPLDLRWIILGESFRDIPPSMRQLKQSLAGRIEHWGYVPERCDYWSLLNKADWVLSTADHEFFGIAVVEALFAGCLPWLPNRLSYPELLPTQAQGLAPTNPPACPSDLRREIAQHLEPARAQAAVARLDDLMERMVQASQ